MCGLTVKKIIAEGDYISFYFYSYSLHISGSDAHEGILGDFNWLIPLNLLGKPLKRFGGVNVELTLGACCQQQRVGPTLESGLHEEVVHIFPAFATSSFDNPKRVDLAP